MKWICRILVGFFTLAVIAVVALFIMVNSISRTPIVIECQAATYEEYVAKFGETDLPKSAKNIRFVRSKPGFFPGGVWIIRLEAPIADCKAYALTTYSSYDYGKYASVPPPEFVLIRESPHKPPKAILEPNEIRDIAWFDIENVSKGLTLPRDHSHRPFICIDTEKEVLYTYWTD